MDKILLENEINPKLYQLWKGYDLFKQEIKQILCNKIHDEQISAFCQIIQLMAFSKEIIDNFVNYIQEIDENEAQKIAYIFQNKQTQEVLSFMKENYSFRYQEISQFFQETSFQAINSETYKYLQIQFEKSRRVYIMYSYQHNLENQQNQTQKLQNIMKENFYCFLVGSKHSQKDQIYQEIKNNYQNQYIELFMDKSIEIQSLIGNYIIGSNVKESVIVWKDGPLLNALQNEKILILTNFELAQNSVQAFVINLIQQGFCNFKNKKISFQGKFRLLIFTESIDQVVDNSLVTVLYEKDNLLQVIQSHINCNQKFMINIIYQIIYIFAIDDFTQIKKFLIRINQVINKFQLNENIDFISTQIQKYILQDFLDIFFEGLPENLFKKQKNDELCKLLNTSENQLKILIEDQSVDYSQQQNIFLQRFQKQLVKKQSSFVYTEENSILIDKILTSIEMKENVLLVGETGTGKTKVIQEISELYNQKLNVFNLSYSTDSIDIFGGFRPVNNEIFFKNQIFELQIYMKKHFDIDKNQAFFQQVGYILQQKDYNKLCLTLIQACKHLVQKKDSQEIQNILLNCQQFYQNPNQFQDQNRFQFVKGILWQCIEKNEWILFDEINMAQEEVLFKLFQVLSEDSISLMDSNQLTEIKKPENFRIFACMNPAYEIGKKPLPQKVQQQFTCYQYPGIQSVQEIHVLLKASFKDLPHYTNEVLMNFAKFFFWLRQETRNNNILDQGSKKIVISIRQLKRAIQITRNTSKYQQMRISLTNSIYMSLRISCYLSMNKESRKKFDQKFNEIFEIQDIQKLYISDKFLYINPEFANQDQYVKIENHIVKTYNNAKMNNDFKFIITSTISNIMSDILKILIYDQNLPVLLEGPTSTGKTTIIQYLGNSMGQKVVRINNHKDTDLDEYIGKFVPTKTGKIKFQEGQLIECMKNGYWLLLDELNLAKSEVLEALNRVFDDNQELYVPELDQIIIPHQNFRIFATQNPNTYSGRSLLSKAFKNRFICINYDTMTSEDIQQIIVQKCQLPKSRVEIMVRIKDKLQYIKTQENLLNNNSGLITVRDLIKWANRKQNLITKQDLVYWGFALLGERIRNIEQKDIVKNIFLKESGVSIIDMNQFYQDQFQRLNEKYQLQQYDDVKWTSQFKKAFVLANQCIENKEPILLVGETGCGKTTLATLFSKIYNIDYFYINCHKNTEVNDFIGNWRPKRNKDEISNKIKEILKKYNIHYDAIDEIPVDLLDNLDDQARKQIQNLIQEIKQEFQWVNGKLIQALQNGGVFLIDEISLANDSVLERFNSLLEFERKLFITESEESLSIELNANEKFFIVGTMNPSGDHGKKELSPALRNRFSEIWMQSILDRENFIHQQYQNEIKQYLEFQICKNIKNIENNLNKLIEYMFYLCKFYNLEQHNILKPLTTRDLQSFIMLMQNNIITLGFNDSIQLATEHFFQSSLGQSQNIDFLIALKNQFYNFTIRYPEFFNKKINVNYMQDDNSIKINNIEIKINQQSKVILDNYILNDQKVTDNLYNILLGLQTQKPLMLEGPPGVGKTSLIQILAKLKNKKLYKVNIFAQTDMMDLLGTDVPDQQRIGHFKWCNGILLNAMIEGAWIIFDELNLANQNVLEGLNSILDHRGEVFIPELNKVVQKVEGFQFFATQNPQSQGRGRKALPQSFLNRFFKIYLNQIPTDSLIKIAKQKLIQNERFQIFEIFYDFISLLLNKKLLQERQFNIRALDRIRSFFLNFYDDQNHKLLMSIALRLFVIQQNWQKINNIQQIACIAENFEIMNNFQIGEKQNQLCLYNNNLEYIQLKNSKNYLKKYYFQDPFSITILLNQALCLQLNFPMLILYDETTNRIKQSIYNLAQQHRKNVRILHLYKNADEQDLLGFYDQFGWEQFLQQINLPLNYKKALKDSTSNKNQQLEILQNIQQVTKDQKLRDQINSLMDIIKKNQQYFKWQDSELVKSVENGDWICIEGCESCSPALLEKLNGLLEDDYLVINECFVDSETVRKVIKHEEFRIFLLFKNKKNIKISAPLQNRCFLFIENQQDTINENFNIFDKSFEQYKLLNYFQKENLITIFQQDKTMNLQNPNFDCILHNHLNIIFQKDLQLNIKQQQKNFLHQILEDIFETIYHKYLFENNANIIYFSKQNQLMYQQQNLSSFDNQKPTNIQKINQNIFVALLKVFNNILYLKQQNTNIVKIQNDEINYVFQNSQFIKQLYVFSVTQPQKYYNVLQATDLMITETQKMFQQNQQNIIEQIGFENSIQVKVYQYITQIKDLIQSNYIDCQQKLKQVFQQFYDQQEYENMNLDFFNQNDNNIYLCLLQNKLDLSQDDDNLQVQIFEKFDKAIQFLQQFQSIDQIDNLVLYLKQDNSKLNSIIFKLHLQQLYKQMLKKLHYFQKFDGNIQEFNILNLYINKIQNIDFDRIYEKNLIKQQQIINNHQFNDLDILNDDLVQIQQTCTSIVQIIGQIEQEIYFIIFTNIKQMAKGFDSQKQLHQFIIDLQNLFKFLRKNLENVQLQQICIQNIEDETLHCRINSFVQNKILSSNNSLDLTLKTQLNESFQKIQKQQFQLQDLLEIAQLYIKLLQKSYFVFKNNNLQEKFYNLVEIFEKANLQYNSVNIQQVIENKNKPQYFYSPNDFLLFQLYQLQWLDIDINILFNVFNQIRNIFTKKLSKTINSMNSDFNQNKSSMITKAQINIEQDNKLNEIAQYEYNKQTVIENKRKQDNEIKTMFNDYLQDFNVDDNQLDQVQKFNISKLEDNYHEQCKNYYFFISLNYLIKKKLQFKTQIQFDDILSTLIRNFENFQLPLQAQNILLKNNMINHIQNFEQKFDLSMLQEVSIEDITDPLKICILNKINKKIQYSKTFSFYSKKNNTKEVQNCFQIVNKVFLSLRQFAIDQLHKDNPSLSILLKICQKTLSFSYNTPLSKIATALQIISKNLQEFNIFLPKELKLQNEVDMVFNLLYEMRKIEKKSWIQMLVLGENQIENQEVQTIHQQQQIIQKSQDMTSIPMIDQHLLQANIGNFSQLLFLYASLLYSDQNFLNKKVLKNILRYYSVINLEAQNEYQNCQKQIYEQMINSQKLMNWQFKDIINLKSNMEKLYRGISKSLKTQREVFETRIEQCFIIIQRQKNIRNDLDQFISFFKNFIENKSEKEDDDTKYINKNQIDQVSQKLSYSSYEDISYFRIINLNDFLCINNLNDFIKDKEFYNVVNHHEIFEEFSKKYLERIESVKNMKLNFKLRCLKDFLQDMQFFVNCRRFDIQSVFTYRIIFENLKIINYDSQIQNLFKNNIIEKDIKQKIFKMNQRIFKVIDNIKNFKQNQIYHDNIPSQYQQKLLSFFLEFYIQYTKYSNIVKKSFSQAQSIIEQIFNKKNKQLNEILFYLQYLLESQKYQNIIKDDIILAQEYIQNIKQGKEIFLKKSFQTENFEFINNLIENIINNEQISKNKQNISNQFETQYSTLRQKFKKFMIQENDKNSNYIEKYCIFGRQLQSYFTELNIIVKTNEYIELQNEYLLELMKVDIQSKILYLINHSYSFNKFVYNLSVVVQNLLYKGFCYQKKDDEQEEVSGSEEMDFGTGMGEGQGDSNVADQIEYEEQLLGEMEDQQQQQGQDQNQQDGDQDSNQMEMENDFGGEDQQQNDKNNEEKNSQEDLDQNMEDINQEDLNPQMYQDSEDEDNQSQQEPDPKSKFELNNDQENHEKEEQLEAKQEKIQEKENQRKISEENAIQEQQSNDEINSLNEENMDQDQEIEEQFDSQVEEQVQEYNQDNEQEIQSLSLNNSENESNQMEIEDEEVISQDDQISQNSQIQDEEKESQNQEVGMNLENDENQQQQIGDQQNYTNQNQEEQNENKEQNLDTYNKKIQEFMNSKEELISSQLIQEMIENVNIQEEQENEQNDNQEDIQQQQDFTQSQQQQEKQTLHRLNRKTQQQQNFEKQQNQQKQVDDILQNSDDTEEEKEMNFNEKKKKDTQKSENQQKVLKQEQFNKMQDLSEIINSYENQDTVEKMFEQENFTQLVQENEQLIEQESDILCEKLKTILDQKQENVLKGDFRTGKKLNMKKIIPYIASNYRKDKIWLRKQDPNEKNYSITIAIDNSASMQEKNVGKIALFSSLILCNAIQKAQLGNLQVCKIETGMQMILKDEQFSRFSYQKLLNEFSFQYSDPNSSDLSMANFVKQYLDNLQEENLDHQKICFIVSDGRMNKEFVKKQLLEIQDPEITFFFVVLDSHDFENSIINYQTSQIIQEDGEIEVIIKNYLEDFPFENYIILKDINHLSNLIVDVLTELVEKNNQ